MLRSIVPSSFLILLLSLALSSITHPPILSLAQSLSPCCTTTTIPHVTETNTTAKRIATYYYNTQLQQKHTLPPATTLSSPYQQSHVTRAANNSAFTNSPLSHSNRCGEHESAEGSSSTEATLSSPSSSLPLLPLPPPPPPSPLLPPSCLPPLTNTSTNIVTAVTTTNTFYSIFDPTTTTTAIATTTTTTTTIETSYAITITVVLTNTNLVITSTVVTAAKRNHPTATLKYQSVLRIDGHCYDHYDCYHRYCCYRCYDYHHYHHCLRRKHKTKISTTNNRLDTAKTIALVAATINGGGNTNRDKSDYTGLLLLLATFIALAYSSSLSSVYVNDAVTASNTAENITAATAATTTTTTETSKTRTKDEQKHLIRSNGSSNKYDERETMNSSSSPTNRHRGLCCCCHRRRSWARRRRREEEKQREQRGIMEGTEERQQRATSVVTHPYRELVFAHLSTERTRAIDSMLGITYALAGRPADVYSFNQLASRDTEFRGGPNEILWGNRKGTIESAPFVTSDRAGYLLEDARRGVYAGAYHAVISGNADAIFLHKHMRQDKGLEVRWYEPNDYVQLRTAKTCILREKGATKRSGAKIIICPFVYGDEGDRRRHRAAIFNYTYWYDGMQSNGAIRSFIGGMNYIKQYIRNNYVRYFVITGDANVYSVIWSQIVRRLFHVLSQPPEIVVSSNDNGNSEKAKEEEKEKRRQRELLLLTDAQYDYDSPPKVYASPTFADQFVTCNDSSGCSTPDFMLVSTSLAPYGVKFDTTELTFYTSMQHYVLLAYILGTPAPTSSSSSSSSSSLLSLATKATKATTTLLNESLSSSSSLSLSSQRNRDRQNRRRLRHRSYRQYRHDCCHSSSNRNRQNPAVRNLTKTIPSVQGEYSDNDNDNNNDDFVAVIGNENNNEEESNSSLPSSCCNTDDEATDTDDNDNDNDDDNNDDDDDDDMDNEGESANNSTAENTRTTTASAKGETEYTYKMIYRTQIAQRLRREPSTSVEPRFVDLSRYRTLLDNNYVSEYEHNPDSITFRTINDVLERLSNGRP